MRFPWGRFGEQLFLVEVESGEEEVALADNRTFQYVSLIPQRDIVVFPNPFRPRSDSALRFSGVPFKAEVRVYAHRRVSWCGPPAKTTRASGAWVRGQTKCSGWA